MFGCFTLILFFLKMGEDFSRVWLATWFLAGLVALTAIRFVLTRMVRRWTAAGVLERRAVLVGGGPEAVDLIRALRDEPANDIRICGIFDDRDDARVPALQEGYPKLGRIDELLEFGRQAEIDMLIVALPITAEERARAAPEAALGPPARHPADGAHHEAALPAALLFLRRLGAVPRPLRQADRRLGRADQARLRHRRRLAGADRALAGAARHHDRDPARFAGAGLLPADAATASTTRSSRFSSFARCTTTWPTRRRHASSPRAIRASPASAASSARSSIDELPQLVNVITGKLSLVGPRPHAVNAHTENRLWEQVVDGYFARHRVKPGITGWAQINGWRGEVDSEDKIRQRVECDLFYIENWSVLLDLYILALTPFRLLNSENAY